MPAGGPYRLSVETATGAAQAIDDVLIGDVWLCSGQSNMEFKVRQGLNALYDAPTLVSDRVRLLTVAHDAAPRPLGGFRTAPSWTAATADAVPDFSAACLYMARELRARDPAPIGLIDASWGGSAIDVWRSEEAIAAAPFDRAGDLALLRRYRTDPAAAYREWGARWERWWRTQPGAAADPAPWATPAATAGWPRVPGPGPWESWGDPSLATFNGLAWFATEATLTPDQASRPATLALGRVEDLDMAWVNGVPVGAAYGPDLNRSYRLAPGVLKPGVNRIVVNVWDGWGDGGLTGGRDARSLRWDDGSSVTLPDAGWRYKFAAGGGEPIRPPWDQLEGVATT